METEGRERQTKGEGVERGHTDTHMSTRKEQGMKTKQKLTQVHTKIEYANDYKETKLKIRNKLSQ